jgi:hypothetical protein
LGAGLWDFDGLRCELQAIEAETEILQGLLACFSARGIPIVPCALLVVASFERTLNRYPAGSSLVWRDVGVLLGLLHLAAADLGLSSCILGTSGLLQKDLMRPGEIDVGAIVFGSTPDAVGI